MKDDSFKDFVAEQLEAVPGLSIRSMFGGYGIYRHRDFFVIIHKGQLYFKVSKKTKPMFTEAGMGPFKQNRKQTLKSFYEVPGDILESRPRLTEWAEESSLAVNSKNREGKKRQ